MPKVSVIIPVYGVEQYIERCAISLFEQTLDDIEYIFVNDCTPDASMDILADVISRYPSRQGQIKIVNMPTNSGQAAVRECGIKSATGEYIIHCDSDDWVDVAMYKSMYEQAVATDSDIVVCDWNIAFSETKYTYISPLVPLEKNKFINGLLDGSLPGYLINKLVKSALYKEVRYYPKDNYTEDMVLSVQLIYYSKRISHIAKGYYYYFQNVESISKKRIDAIHTLKLGEQVFNNFNIIYQFLQQQPDYNDFAANVTLRKYRVKLFVRNYCLYPGGTKRWRTIFPELKPFSVFRYNLPWRTKIGYIITHLGIYGLCNKQINK